MVGNDQTSVRFQIQMATQVSRDRVICTRVALLAVGHVASTQLAKAPWSTVGQTYLSSRATTSLMGP